MKTNAFSDFAHFLVILYDGDSREEKEKGDPLLHRETTMQHENSEDGCCQDFQLIRHLKVIFLRTVLLSLLPYTDHEKKDYSKIEQFSN